MPPPVLITRPHPAATQLADLLYRRWGAATDVVISPVLDVAFLDVALDLQSVGALAFTSRNGVEAFARLTSRRDLECFVVGRATLAAAERIGLTARCAGADVAMLGAALKKTPPRAPILHLRGAHAAGDLCGDLRRSGIDAREQVIYQQNARPLTEDAQHLLQADAPVLLPLFSPRSAQLLFSHSPIKAPLLIAAMSVNVARHIPMEQVKQLNVALTPDLNAMLDSLDQLRDCGIELEGTNRAQ